ncbi:MAG TPA: DUF2799 domain-containing protein, partial [Cellvibrionaceae bacterium]|nr:DUF2799 domain-containing protein [Cellvibrionaceae bacterium]
MKTYGCLFAMAIALSGCAGGVKEVACSGQNWAGFGYKMGSEGRSVHEFDSHRSACGSNLEKGALKAYLDGYTRGIIEYCTYDNGYMVGSKNQSISDNCPAELRASYTKGYNLGKIEFAEKVRQMHNQVEDAESRQHKAQNENIMSSP